MNVPTPRGQTIRPLPYLLTGVGLSCVKMAIDLAIAERIFQRPWALRRYVFPGEVLNLDTLTVDDRNFALAMTAAALPFVIIGVTLTVRRLRDAGKPLWPVVLFFLPLPFNVISLLVIAALPSKPFDVASALQDLPGEAAEPKKGDVLVIGPEPPVMALGAMLPENDFLCGLASIVITLPITALFGFLSINLLDTYGWGLFIGLPFAMPMLSVIIFGLRKPRGPAACLLMGWGWIALAFLMMVVFAFEGIVCLILLLPLAIPIVTLGAVVGYYIALIPWSSRSLGPLLLILGIVPTLIGAEGVMPRERPLFSVTTVTDVDAPPEVVWKHVVTVSELPPPDDWIFRTGIAYPVRATIDGHGPGAMRRCEFSTGAFEEPIEVWDEPHRLAFSVISSPPPMKEWSPFVDIHPPHLDNYLVSRRGEFRLTSLGPGRTRLEGTTWYHHSMWPAAYWKIWSDGIIRRIHGQVLKHVKRQAEAETRSAN